MSKPLQDRRYVRRLAVAVAAAGSLVLAACGGQTSTRQVALSATPSAQSSENSVPAQLPSSSPQVAASPLTSAAADPPSASVSPSPSPSGQNLAAARPAVPVRMRIPAIKVDAPVEQVGVAPDGAMDVPRKYEDVGWFSPGYRPGEPGNAVVGGHLDSTTGPAVFWNLQKLNLGDTVVVQLEDGSERRFAVVAKEVYQFDQAPLQQIFGPSAKSRVNLVTCDGAFDRATKNYSKRLVVYTELVA